ncbi:MAG: LPS export ABC transporter periplasmic protein LptC [Bacteroidales bacterium]|nr:LPS export ABC transporter periplasmic protein LptC [Bacteroidales bacterium]MBN2699729.1 LPS export ABC transporter periplasmic protein LptC [Bacteroidales bacterium]
MKHFQPYYTWLAAFLLWWMTGCENDIEKVNMLTGDSLPPRVVGTNVEVLFSDSARVKVQIQAPEFRQYTGIERPYLEFPEGAEIYFYDDSLRIESRLRADYAVYYNEEKLWQATGNVEAVRLTNGDQLNTEELFWDEEKELIYSNTFTRIHNQDDTFYGKNGFESHQNLNNWQLKGSSGTVNLRDEE